MRRRRRPSRIGHRDSSPPFEQTASNCLETRLHEVPGMPGSCSPSTVSPDSPIVNASREISVTYASSRITIDVSADAAWRVIGDFDAACQYLAMVVDCTVVGARVGALRTVTSADGSTIVERLEALDEASYRLSHALLTDTPFRDCLTTVTVHARDRGRCEVTWAATFDADGLPANEALDMLEGALTANCLALKQLFEG
jgi:hypothetical protein